MTFELAQLGARLMVGAAGAAKFATALARGDVAPDCEVKYRRSVCLSCPTRKRLQVGEMEAPGDWCGNPLMPADSPPSCGCLIYGKTLVGSEVCPQGKWGVVPRGTSTYGNGTSHKRK